MNMISKLDTSSWKEFKVSEIFECKTTKAISSDELIDGDTLYVTRSATNNGCSGFLQKVNSKVNEPNCITIGAEGKFAFYQDAEFEAGVKIYTLRNGQLNKFNALFLCTLLNLEVFKYSYGRARVLEKIKDENIKLPTNKLGLPDYDYMENYIRNLWGGSLKTSVPCSKVIFNTLEWKTYKFSDLFEIERGKITQLNELENGKCPIVSAYGEKQGIQFFGNIEPKYENCITASMNGSGTGYFSYHEDKFEANSDCGVLLPKFKLNKYIGLFLVTIANMSAYRYTYGRKLTINRLENETIKLPSNEKFPDWDYMENFIKNLQYSDLI